MWFQTGSLLFVRVFPQSIHTFVEKGCCTHSHALDCEREIAGLCGAIWSFFVKMGNATAPPPRLVPPPTIDPNSMLNPIFQSTSKW